MMIKYAIFIMRGQPFHIGHQSNIDKAIQDGLQPVIIFGSANESRTSKNPFTVPERIDMARLVYPNILAGGLCDSPSNEEWVNELKHTIREVTNAPLTYSVVYTHEKDKDRYDFSYMDRDYKNESYCRMFEAAGLQTKAITTTNYDIHATDIRNDLENNKHFLHPKVYAYIKDSKCLQKK